MTGAKVVARDCDETVLQDHTDLHPVFRRVLAGRGINSLGQIDYQLKYILPPEQIRNLFDAAELLCRAIQHDKKVLVFGDYDADGATSTALCIRALNLMGYQRVSYLMPDRFVDGYGLSLSVAKRLLEQQPDCVITVDNGIASIDGIALLQAQNIDVIVTDHHLPASTLPNASVIVNQNAWPQETEGRNLAGVGIAFYLMLATRSRLREEGWFVADRPEPNLACCLDLVAIGSVADLVPLDYHNRILINEGLRRIRSGACSEGIKALIRVAAKHLDNFISSDIAFGIAPRINAAGRLDDMTVGVQCLLADTADSAIALASELNDINQQRREIQQQMAEEANLQLKQVNQVDFVTRKSIVLYQEDWHEGIVGIVASKIKEKYHRPCVVFAKGEDGRLKGSGRSISGIHLRDLLDLVDKRIPGNILKFGGHAMAAGLTLSNDSLAVFIDTFESVINEYIDTACFDLVIECDGELEATELNLSFASELQNLSPWGQRFPMPSFIGEFEVINQRVLGEKHLKLTIQVEGDIYIDAIAFFQPANLLNKQYEKIRIHYELAANRFRGVDSVQLLIRDIL